MAAAADDELFVVGWADPTAAGTGTAAAAAAVGAAASSPPTPVVSAVAHTPCRGCITALAASGPFIAVAELLRSVAVYKLTRDGRGNRGGGDELVLIARDMVS